MKIWAISDTHMKHGTLTIPEADMVIYAGDSTNYANIHDNQKEFEIFIDWFRNLPFEHKILIAGNHDAWATKKYNVDFVLAQGIHYLEHDMISIPTVDIPTSYMLNTDSDGIRIFGSPYTPTFGNWHFMKDRSKIGRYWDMIEESDRIDILVTHGPPKGILDLSADKKHQLEYCGDNALLKMVKRIKPKYHIFGHIHDNSEAMNAGHFIRDGINFMNVSCVTDGKFVMGCSSNGIVFEI